MCNSTQWDKNNCSSNNNVAENKTKNITLSASLEHLRNHEVACRHMFLSVEEGVSALLSQRAGAAHIPTSHNAVKVLWLYSLAAPHPVTAPEEVRPNWLISRKDWSASKISGNKSILKTCSMPYNSIGDNKICAFPFWSLFSCYTVSHCSFSQEKKFIYSSFWAKAGRKMNKTGGIK